MSLNTPEPPTQDSKLGPTIKTSKDSGLSIDLDCNDKPKNICDEIEKKFDEVLEINEKNGGDRESMKSIIGVFGRVSGQIQGASFVYVS